MSKSISLVSSKNILPKTRALISHLAYLRQKPGLSEQKHCFSSLGFPPPLFSSTSYTHCHPGKRWCWTKLSKKAKKEKKRHLLFARNQLFPCTSSQVLAHLPQIITVSRTCWIKHSFRNSLSPVQHPSRLWGSWALQAFWGREESSFLSHRGRRRGWRTWTRPPAPLAPYANMVWGFSCFPKTYALMPS